MVATRNPTNRILRVRIHRVELWTASVDVQLKTFERMVTANPMIAAILRRMPELGLQDCWLTAGCLFQTVWNTLSDRDLQAGILDYDVNYFDASDLSWDAENRSIRRATNVFADLEARFEVRNEARVHLWYEAKFGTPCPPYRSTAHAVSTFPNCSSCVAVRPNPDGLEVYAPYGFTDLFRMTLRPNPGLAPAAVYAAKAARWKQQWPTLTVLPWPT